MNYSIAQNANFVGYGGGPVYKCFRKGFLKGPETMPAHEARFIIDTPDWWTTWVMTMYDWYIDDPIGSTNFPEIGYAYRHPGQTLNALYMDGHVEPVAHRLKTGKYVYQILWTLPVP